MEMTVHSAFDKADAGCFPDDPILGKAFPDVASTIHVAVERLFRILRDEFAQFLKETSNLKLQEWRVLTALSAGGWLPQKDIVKVVVMEQAQVSRALSDMQKAGLVLTRRDTSDRRVWCFSLSAEGRRLYERLRGLAITRKTALDSVLEDQEKMEFFACLRKVASHALDGKVEGVKMAAQERENRR